jgi:hypothetical protein
MTTRFEVQAALNPIFGHPYRGRVNPKHVETFRAFFRRALETGLYPPGSEFDIGTVGVDAEEQGFNVPLSDEIDDACRAAALLEGIGLITYRGLTTMYLLFPHRDDIGPRREDIQKEAMFLEGRAAKKRPQPRKGVRPSYPGTHISTLPEPSQPLDL